MATERQAAKLKVFISYSRADTRFADELVAGLEFDGGFDMTIDRHSIEKGEDWKARLGALIEAADTVVFVLSPTSATSHICRWEVERAAELNKRILPVLHLPLAGVAPPPVLGKLNYVDFTVSPTLIAGIREVATALRIDIGWLREGTRLLNLALDWARAERRDNRLLSGPDIVEAKKWLADCPPTEAPTELHRDYIRASEAAEVARLDVERGRLVELAAAQEAAALQARRVAGRTLTGLIAAVVLAGIAGGAGWLAWGQRETAVKSAETARAEAARAEDARKQILVTESRLLNEVAKQLVRRGENSDALALARFALPLDLDHPERPFVRDSIQALIEAMRDVRELAVLRGHSGPVLGADESPDGNLLTWATDGSIRLWSKQGEATLVIHAHAPCKIQRFQGAKFLSGGRQIASWGCDAAVRIWDASSGRLIKTIGQARALPRSSAVRGAVLSENEDTAFVATESGIEIYGIMNQSLITTVPTSSAWGWGVSQVGGGGKWIVYAEMQNTEDQRIIKAYRVRNLATNDETELMFPDEQIWRDTNGGLATLKFQHSYLSDYIEAVSSDYSAAVGLAVWRPGSPRPIFSRSIPNSRYSGGLALGSANNVIVYWTDDSDLMLGNGETELRLSGHETVSKIFSGSGDVNGLGEATINRHVGTGVQGAVFSRDKKRFATWAFDRSVRVWDAENGRLLLTLRGHEADIGGVTFDSTGERILSWSADHVARVWSVKTGRQIALLAGHEHLGLDGDKPTIAEYAARFVWQDRAVMSWGGDGTARIWNIETVPNFGVNDDVQDVDRAVFSFAGTHVATWQRPEASSASIFVVGLSNGRGHFRFLGHTAAVQKVIAHPSLDGFISLDVSGRILVWSALDGSILRDIPRSQKLRDFGVNAATKLLWVRSYEAPSEGAGPETGIVREEVTAFDLDEGNPQTPKAQVVDQHMFFGLDNLLVMVAPPFSTWRIIDMMARKTTSVGAGLGSDALTEVSFSADGKRLLAQHPGGVVSLIDATNGIVIGSRRFEELKDVEFGEERRVYKPSPNAFQVLVGKSNTLLRLANIGDPSRDVVLENSLYSTSHIAARFSPNGDRVFTWSSYDPRLRAWSTATGEQIFEIQPHYSTPGATSIVSDIRFDSNGARFVTWSSESRVRVWDAWTGAELFTFHQGDIFTNDAVFSPDGNHLLIRGNDATRVWPVTDKALVDIVDQRLKRIQPLTASERCRYLSTSVVGCP